MADAEFIVVCIDNSTEMHLSKNYEAQLDAIKYYCKTKLKANPKTEVVLFEMGDKTFGPALSLPTSDLQEILDLYTSIEVNAGRLRFYDAIHSAPEGFKRCPRYTQKRMLFFAGGPVDVDDRQARKYGNELNRLGIAVDVVNFFLQDTNPARTQNQFGWRELDAFVEAAKHKHNSHIEHVKHRSSESYIQRALSNSILRDTISLYKKSSGRDSDKDKNLGGKRKREEKRTEESKNPEKGHKKGKGGSSENPESASKFSAKLMKLHVEGKPEEAIKLLKEAKES